MGFHSDRFAAITGLTYETKGNLFYGEIEGYPVSIYRNRRQNVLICRIAGQQREAYTGEEMQQKLDDFRMEHIGVAQLQYKDHVIAAAIAVPSAKPEENAAETVRALVELAAALHLTPCCQGCGAESGWKFYALDGDGVMICDACRAFTERNISEIREKKKEERPFLPGTVAAILLGAALTFVLGYFVLRLSRLMFLTCYISTAATFLLMRKLGKKVTLPAAVTAAVLCFLSAVFALTAGLAADIADFNRENETKFTSYTQTYADFTEKLSGMSEEELRAAENEIGASLSDLAQQDSDYKLALNNQSTWDCIRHFPALWGSTLYQDMHRYLIRLAIHALIAVLLCTLLTVPPMLREGSGIHKLRELPA